MTAKHTPTPYRVIAPGDLKELVLRNIRRCFALRRRNSYSKILLKADYNDLREIIQYYRAI